MGSRPSYGAMRGASVRGMDGGDFVLVLRGRLLVAGARSAPASPSPSGSRRARIELAAAFRDPAGNMIRIIEPPR